MCCLSILDIDTYNLSIVYKICDTDISLKNYLTILITIIVYLFCRLEYSMGFPGSLMVKKLPASSGDTRDNGLILGSARSPGGGSGNPLQHSCLENPMDREAWQATVHGVAKSQKRQTQLSTQGSWIN